MVGAPQRRHMAVAADQAAEITRDRVLIEFSVPEASLAHLQLVAQNDARAVSPELFDVLSRFDLWRTRTNGALDASAETISRVWKVAAAVNRVPTDDAIAAAFD